MVSALVSIRSMVVTRLEATLYSNESCSCEYSSKLAHRSMLDDCRAARTRLLKIVRICWRPAYIRLGDDDVVFVIAVDSELSMMKGLSMPCVVCRRCVEGVCDDGVCVAVVCGDDVCQQLCVCGFVPSICVNNLRISRQRSGSVWLLSKALSQSCADPCFAAFDVHREC